MTPKPQSTDPPSWEEIEQAEKLIISYLEGRGLEYPSLEDILRNDDEYLVYIALKRWLP